MATLQIPDEVSFSLAESLPGAGENEIVSLDELITQGLIPADLEWQPNLCLKISDNVVLVHVLADREIPEYVVAAADKVRTASNKIKVVILARQLLVETERSKSFVLAQYAAASVAEQCVKARFGLAFEVNSICYLVFPWEFVVPSSCNLDQEETGHIPRWLIDALAASARFSPFMQDCLRSLKARYVPATSRKKLNYEKECDLLIGFAKAIAKGNRKLYFPLGQLDLLREWELRRANPKARDHFFHTFNNFFLGLYILSNVTRDGEELSDVDSFISTKKKSGKLATWEALWVLTCLFHDPGYVAESYWGTFRFSYGFTENEALEEDEIPKAAAEHIRNAWETEFAKPRADLVDLYDRTIRKWVPPSQRKSKHVFDGAMQEVYFDGRSCSHSLVSGLKLIKYCSQSNVPSSHDPDESVKAANIAALSMMFHDPRCRGILLAQGIEPIPFGKLPYATLLMFVDSIQDDRRSIERSRFKQHGVLSHLAIDEANKRVTAEICLPELAVRFWSGRIAEYESVMKWVNHGSDWEFIIDYKSRTRTSVVESPET
jgi:hypothetical protein